MTGTNLFHWRIWSNWFYKVSYSRWLQDLLGGSCYFLSFRLCRIIMYCQLATPSGHSCKCIRDVLTSHIIKSILHAKLLSCVHVFSTVCTFCFSDDFSIVSVNGMLLNPLTLRWSWFPDTSINYALHAVKNTIQNTEHTESEENTQHKTHTEWWEEKIKNNHIVVYFSLCMTCCISSEGEK